MFLTIKAGYSVSVGPNLSISPSFSDQIITLAGDVSNPNSMLDGLLATN